MVYSLVARNVLVTGGSRGLGALIAEKFAEEGCNVAVNYLQAADRAEQVAEKVRGHGRKAVVIQGDVGIQTDCRSMVKQSIKQLGGLDIIINNAGWTKITAFGDLDALSEEEWDKCWAVNTKSNMHLLREAVPTFNANPDGGVFLISSSVAGTIVGGSTMAYSVTKAAGLHLMQCLAQTQGPKIRVNAVLPGWLPTEWGNKFDEERIGHVKSTAVLKQETKLDDTVDAFVMAAKNSSMTGAKLRIDSGLAIRP